MSTPQDIPTINLRKMNLRHFCHETKHYATQFSGREFPRVLEGLYRQAGEFAIELDGDEKKQADGAMNQYFNLQVRGEVQLECQRCLEVVNIVIDNTAQFILVTSEEQADALEAAAALQGLDADETPEPLVANRALDVMVLAEDEILLSLPIVPMHDVCPKPLITLKADNKARLSEAPNPPNEEEKPNPFAMLKALKKSQD